MLVTLLLSLILIASIFGMLCAAVCLIQSKKLFTTAPKDIQAAAKEHPQRFPGQHVLGWKLATLCLLIAIGTFVYGGWDGIKTASRFGSSLCASLLCSTFGRRSTSYASTGFC